MAARIDEVLTDTKTLQEQFKKKIKGIGADLESTKKFRESLTLVVNQLRQQTNSVADTCDGNHMKLTEHSNRIALKFSETTIDLKSASEGFQREIERVHVIFRELQQEFLTQLEEKRQHNETLLRGAGIEEAELRKAETAAKNNTQKNMASLLPKLKKTHIDANLRLADSQQKIIGLMKGDKLSPMLNNASSRKFFREPSDLQSSIGADLKQFNHSSAKFIPGSGSDKAFMTQV
jgi:membrane-associated HD superfamily phosphohydrolase